MARQLVRKTPFTSGYSEQARVDVDFGDFDNFEVGEMPGNAAELEQIRRAASPLYREDLRFKNPKKLRKLLKSKWIQIQLINYQLKKATTMPLLMHG